MTGNDENEKMVWDRKISRSGFKCQIGDHANAMPRMQTKKIIENDRETNSMKARQHYR